MKTKQSAAYRKGFVNGGKQHYWTHLFNSHLEGFATLAEQVDFHNGYHDALADSLNLARPAHVQLADVKDIYALYIYP